MAKEQNLNILQGKTFTLPVRWETTPIQYKPITGISRAAPCLITCAGHGVPDGWRVAVMSAKGLVELNSVNNPPKDKDYRIATVVDANTIEFNDVNSSEFKVYTSGGYIVYNTPTDLTGFTARMSIRDKAGGTELLSLTTANSGVEVDNLAKAITLNLSAVDAASLTWKKGVYDLELVSPSSEVTLLLYGKVSVVAEVTT